MNFVGENKIVFESVLSTNEELKVRDRSVKLPEGTLLYASKQDEGKGQFGSKWEVAPNKNFTGTYLLRPSIVPEKAYVMNLIASLAVKETVVDFIGEEGVKIKWPNDILVNSKKVCGILVENVIQNVISTSYVGIGLNINQKEFSDFKRPATSLSLEGGEDLEIGKIIEQLSIHLQQFYMLFKTKGELPLVDLYSRDLYQMGEWKLYNTNEKEELRILGITPEGLKAEDRSGNEKVFRFKEIEFLS